MKFRGESTYTLMREFTLIKDKDFESEPELGEILRGICAELYIIVNTLIDEKKPLLAFAVITGVIRTFRTIIETRNPDIKQVVRELKRKIDTRDESDERPILRVGRHGSIS